MVEGRGAAGCVWIEMGNPPRVADLEKADGRAGCRVCVDRMESWWAGGKGGNVLRLAVGSLRAAPREWRPLRRSQGTHNRPAMRDTTQLPVPKPPQARSRQWDAGVPSGHPSKRFDQARRRASGPARRGHLDI